MKFIEEYKTKISERLNIDKNKLILADVHRGSLAVHAAILDSTLEKEKAILGLEKEFKITKVNEKPIFEALQINQNIIDIKWNKDKDEWCKNKNRTRGGEIYIPPLNWYGIGLNVLNKYENNDWLDCKNKKGEYAVGYIGINNLFNNKDAIIEDLSKMSEEFKDTLTNKLYVNDKNLRKSRFQKIVGTVGRILSIPISLINIGLGIGLYAGSTYIYNLREKCGDGVCVFQNPEFAENSAGIIDLFGYRIKIIIMCRVNPEKIRQPENFKKCWILNPTEVRPYRILIKKISFSPLAGALNDTIITTISPIDYIIDAIKSNNLTFMEIGKKKNSKKFQ